MAPESHQVHTRQPLEVTVIGAIPDSIDVLAPMVSYPRQADRSHSPASPRLLARNNMTGRPIDRTNLEIPRYQHDPYQHRHLGGGNINILDGRCTQCGRTALEHLYLGLLAAVTISQQGPLINAPSEAPPIVIPSGVHASTQAREVQAPTTDTNWRIGLWIMLFACLFVMPAVIIANF
ncbi:hypothetical protein BS50DRAFT_308599 [Corynespora cassiicola Philippines]|uniref:Uncharacterized protein n=1 Tax=Corynespora cassiicola Philippines TaxID=1448308 RepID=A0A2T2NY66_CORCC|nr:hypothetical protein BS50DRAFT_308599 [Corynespora cassiicola Philippines]